MSGSEPGPAPLRGDGATHPVDRPEPLATTVVTRLVHAGATVAVAESLTGGLVVAALTSVPGASAVVRGAVVAYATDLKATLLAEDPVLLAEAGPVDARVAEGMAQGARERLGATFGLATTGEAGPESGSGAPVGTVFVALDAPSGSRCLALRLAGDREHIRAATTRAALALLAESLDSAPGPVQEAGTAC